MDIVKSSDYIIDLGPEGGDGGGQLIAEGTPEEVAKNEKSFTAHYIKEVLDYAEKKDHIEYIEARKEMPASILEK